MHRILVLSLACIAMGLLVGCGKKEGEMSMEEMMKAPPRPAELDKLQPFVGRWEGRGSMTIMDKPMQMHGVSTMNWEADNRVLVSRGEVTMGEGGQKMQEFGMWMWDPKAKKYVTFWAGGDGSMEHGTATYDDDARTWKMQSKGRDGRSGDATVSEGTMKMTDNNTMEWSFTSWDSWKMHKMFEGHGTSQRRP